MSYASAVTHILFFNVGNVIIRGCKWNEAVTKMQQFTIIHTFATK
jgi:hypothetical protein